MKNLNITLLVLIPKKGGVEDLKDFRPISLVGALYKLLAKVYVLLLIQSLIQKRKKLLAKVLANRIKVVGKVVSNFQNAFVEGRQILVVVLIANEAFDLLLKSNESGLLCKLDIEKVYDHVIWDFLLVVLKKMGFGHLMNNGPLLKTFSPGLNGNNKITIMEHEFIRCREEEMGRRQQTTLTYQGAERMLEEEAARYELDVNLGGLKAQGASSSNSFCFGRSPEREGYDHSGVRREGVLVGSGSRDPNAEEKTKKRNGCWDLVEINSVEPLGRNSGWPNGVPRG